MTAEEFCNLVALAKRVNDNDTSYRETKRLIEMMDQILQNSEREK